MTSNYTRAMEHVYPTWLHPVYMTVMFCLSLMHYSMCCARKQISLYLSMEITNSNTPRGNTSLIKH